MIVNFTLPLSIHNYHFNKIHREDCIKLRFDYDLDCANFPDFLWRQFNFSIIFVSKSKTKNKQKQNKKKKKKKKKSSELVKG